MAPLVPSDVRQILTSAPGTERDGIRHDDSDMRPAGATTVAMSARNPSAVGCRHVLPLSCRDLPSSLAIVFDPFLIETLSRLIPAARLKKGLTLRFGMR
jgi:hypothetical protein